MLWNASKYARYNLSCFYLFFFIYIAACAHPEGAESAQVCEALPTLADVGIGGYDDMSTLMIPIASRSSDSNYIVFFGEEDPLFLRIFKNKTGAGRCAFVKKVLQTLCTSGVAPQLVDSSKMATLVTFLKGRESRLDDWRAERALDKLLSVLERFSQSLSDADFLREKTLLALAKKGLRKIKSSKISSFLHHLLKQWEQKFGKEFSDMQKIVVHGDLHSNNIMLSENRMWLVDFSLCGYGYAIEDIARFSVFNALGKTQERYLLQRYFKDALDDSTERLLEACKTLALFVWAFLESQRLSRTELQDAMFCVKAERLGPEWFAQQSLRRQRMSNSEAQMFVTYAVRRMQKLLNKKDRHG
ncbi:MAG: aminoglycoside phosphotransferase family protein [Alphaproteobacteria bacterium]|nr:aminoglycoside phosphotransferase family protein [Alphaproteobacteria bacterium]